MPLVPHLDLDSVFFQSTNVISSGPNYSYLKQLSLEAISLENKKPVFWWTACRLRLYVSLPAPNNKLPPKSSIFWQVQCFAFNVTVSRKKPSHYWWVKFIWRCVKTENSSIQESCGFWKKLFSTGQWTVLLTGEPCGSVTITTCDSEVELRWNKSVEFMKGL